MACHAPFPVGGTLQSLLRASHHRVPKLIGSSPPIASIDDHALFKRLMLFFACRLHEFISTDKWLFAPRAAELHCIFFFFLFE
jgi:hypothetical protein